MTTRFIISFFSIFLLAAVSRSQIAVAPYPEGTVSLSPFKHGFAKVFDNNRIYYLNTKGDKFELAEENRYGLGDETAIVDYENEQSDPDYHPKTVINYGTDKGFGILSPKGEILLEAVYDRIDVRPRVFWKVMKDGKTSLFLADQTLLPFFDEVGYLDGEYFDVKENGKWHLYSKSKKQIVTKNEYEGFDYCGGCSYASPYVYAQKNDKWGVISWDEKVLIPFEYEHTHHGMRSDNWVNSFSKNGKRLIVNIVNQQEFDKGEISSGYLLTKENGLYGAYGQDGKVTIPFEYENIELPNENSYLGYDGPYFITTKQHKKGVIDREGNQILPHEYDAVMIYDDYFVGNKNNISYLFSNEQKELLKIENGEITHINDYFYSSGGQGVEVFKIKKKAFYGLYFGKVGKYVEPAYYEVDFFNSNNPDLKKQYLKAEKNGLLAVFDLEGNLLLEDCHAIKDLYNGTNGLISYTRQGRDGIYDLKSRKEVLPALYNSFDVWNSGKEKIIRAAIREKPEDSFSTSSLIYHLYNMDGKRLVDFDAEALDTLGFSRYLLKVKGNGYVVLHLEGLQSENLNYQAVYTLNTPRLLLVSHDDKTGKLYDIEQKKELTGVYGLDWVKRGYLSANTGKELVLFHFKHGMALVHNENGYGYINDKGKLVVKPQFDWAFDFTGNAAMVCKSETGNRNDYSFKMGFIGKNGKYIFPLEYDLDNASLNHEESFFTGNAVKLPQQSNYQYLYGLGDAERGKILLPVEYSQMRNVGGGKFLLLEKNKKFGIAHTTGEILVPVEFDDIMFNPSSYYNWSSGADEDIFPLLVSKDGKWRYIDSEGIYLPIVGNRANAY